MIANTNGQESSNPLCPPHALMTNTEKGRDRFDPAIPEKAFDAKMKSTWKYPTARILLSSIVDVTAAPLKTTSSVVSPSPLPLDPSSICKHASPPPRIGPRQQPPVVSRRPLESRLQTSVETKSPEEPPTINNFIPVICTLGLAGTDLPLAYSPIGPQRELGSSRVCPHLCGSSHAADTPLSFREQGLSRSLRCDQRRFVCSAVSDRSTLRGTAPTQLIRRYRFGLA